MMDLRKALLILVTFFGLIFIFLFWNQTPGPSLIHYQQQQQQRAFSKNDNKLNEKNNNLRTTNNDDTSPILHRKQWTWDCLNGRCEKRETSSSKSSNPVTLETCSMICGTTQLWPRPTGPFTLGTRYVRFNYDHIVFENDAKGEARRLLEEAFAIFMDNLSLNYGDGSGGLNNLNATDVKSFAIKVNVVDSSTIKLNLATSEAYNLTVAVQDDIINVKIKANNFFGARHALETLSQLVWTNDASLVILKTIRIVDEPKFPYRGILLDTARNFVPLTGLKRTLNGMAANKLNVLHWHMTDSQSFPLDLKALPLFAKYGAYSKEMTYKEEDVEEIVKYARVRGIRVVIEIDTPAHAGNGWTWGKQEGLGDLAVCVNARPWSLYCGEPPCGQLNPENPHVYDVLQRIYGTLLRLTQERELFHVGGDEVNLDCWSQFLPSSRTTTTTNFTDLHELWGNFTTKAIERLTRANNNEPVKYVIIWSSNLTKRPYLSKYLDKERVVVQSWGASQWPDTNDLLADGYKVIVSHVDAWYLDCGFGRWRETGDAACDPYRPWQTVYNHRPWYDETTLTKQILGGEACLWSEQLDVASLDTRLWPRAAAFAERVWSDPINPSSSSSTTGGSLNVDSYSTPIAEDVYARLAYHRKRLIGRGLSVEALWPEWCTENPGMCL